jgi:hypothetical protein
VLVYHKAALFTSTKVVSLSSENLRPLPAIKASRKMGPRHFTNAGHEIDLQKPVCCDYLNSTFCYSLFADGVAGNEHGVRSATDSGITIRSDNRFLVATAQCWLSERTTIICSSSSNCCQEIRARKSQTVERAERSAGHANDGAGGEVGNAARRDRRFGTPRMHSQLYAPYPDPALVLQQLRACCPIGTMCSGPLAWPLVSSSFQVSSYC